VIFQGKYPLINYVKSQLLDSSSQQTDTDKLTTPFPTHSEITYKSTTSSHTSKFVQSSQSPVNNKDIGMCVNGNGYCNFFCFCYSIHKKI
jgi:hypothetical protein